MLVVDDLQFTRPCPADTAYPEGTPYRLRLQGGPAGLRIWASKLSHVLTFLPERMEIGRSEFQLPQSLPNPPPPHCTHIGDVLFVCCTVLGRQALEGRAESQRSLDYCWLHTPRAEHSRSISYL